MAEVVVFHHARGLTPGVRAFADELRAAGHTVHAPDLFDGRVFETTEDGVAHAQELGFGNVMRRGKESVERLPEELVYAGFSMGVLAAQLLAQTRPGARGALFFYSCVPFTEFGEAWPDGVPVQIHAKDADPYFVDEGDIEAARALVEATDSAELFLYPGREHLFLDSSTEEYDEDAARLATERALAFLASV